MLAVAALPGAARAAAEADVMAAFVYNFARFAEWPADAFVIEPRRLNLCVIDARQDLEAALGRLEGKPVQAREIRLMHHPRGAALAACHIAWVGSPAQLAAIREAAGGSSFTLTVGDSDDFAQAGGMIRLATEGKRVIFDVDLEAIQRSRVRLSSQVLRLARSTRRVTPQARP